RERRSTSSRASTAPGSRSRTRTPRAAAAAATRSPSDRPQEPENTNRRSRRSSEICGSFSLDPQPVADEVLVLALLLEGAAQDALLRGRLAALVLEEHEIRPVSELV